MFRSQKHLEKTEFVRIGLDKPITIPGNNQHQVKTNYKFTFTDQDNWFDWYNAYFRADFTFEATADGAAVAGDVRSAPINGSFSLIKQTCSEIIGQKHLQRRQHSQVKSEFARRPGRGDTCHLSDLDETLPD